MYTKGYKKIKKSIPTTLDCITQSGFFKHGFIKWSALYFKPTETDDTTEQQTMDELSVKLWGYHWWRTSTQGLAGIDKTGQECKNSIII